MPKLRSTEDGQDLRAQSLPGFQLVVRWSDSRWSAWAFAGLHVQPHKSALPREWILERCRTARVSGLSLPHHVVAELGSLWTVRNLRHLKISGCIACASLEYSTVPYLLLISSHVTGLPCITKVGNDVQA